MSYEGIFGDIFEDDGGEQSPPEENCHSASITSDCHSALFTTPQDEGCHSALFASPSKYSRRTEEQKNRRENTLLDGRMPFSEASALDVITRRIYDDDEKKSTVPKPVRLAYAVMILPSIRKTDAGTVSEWVETVIQLDEIHRAIFESELQRLQEVHRTKKELPRFMGCEVAEYVKIQVAENPLNVQVARRHEKRFAYAINCLFRWQEITGEKEDMVISNRVLASTLEASSDDKINRAYANAVLHKAISLGFIVLKHKGGMGSASTYRFIGRVVDGVIVPGDPTAPYPI
jgi:hypothetical protein